MAQRDIDKIDKTILDNFYKLVHSQPNVRLTAASSTYKILDGMRKRNQKIFNENLNYSIDRLVAGLASSRALARRGYATLLLEILKNYQVSTERLFSIASQKFGHICKETSRDNLIAYFLLISIILVSGNYNKSKANNQNLDKIYKSLRLLQGIKSYMDFPISKILVEYYELFHPFMVLDIPRQAFGSDVRVSPTELLIMVLCHKKDPIRAMSGLDSAGLMNLCSCLKDEKFQKRPLHPLFKQVGQFIIDNHKQSFKQFYGEIVFKLLFKPNHNELAAMGLELVAELIDAVDQSDDIEMLVSDHLVKTLILSLRKRTSLYAPCQKFFLSLKEQFARQQPPNDEKQFTIIDLLTNSPGSLAFDEDSKSSSIDGLLQSCSAGVLKRYLEKLIESLKKNRLEISCARQIGYVVRRPQLIEDKPTMTKAAKFLLFHSMFEVCQSCSDPTYGRESIDFAAPVREALKNAYHTTLDHIISACDSGQRLEQLNVLIEWADSHIKRKGTKLVASSSSHSCEEEVSDDLKLWSNYMISLNSHKELVKKNDASKQLQPITCLYYFYGLQIVEHMLECTSQLEELNQSANEVLKADPADGSWADILTDQIIAILSATECNTWVRTLCEKVFGSLLPHISPTSIDLMCDAIRSRDECDEDPDGDSEFDEEESEDDGDENEDDDDDDDDEDEEEEEDEGMEVDEIDSVGEDGEHSIELEQEEDAKIEARGSKLADDPSDQEIEDEEDDEEYLDDEQMMKLDSVLADMFKLNRVAKKKKNDPTFTLRCLDLVKKVISKKHNDVETINTLLATLIPVANSSKKLAETRPIWDKIVGMLTKMPGKSKYPELVKFLENKPVGGKQQKRKKKSGVEAT